MSKILSLSSFKKTEDIFCQQKIQLSDLDTVCFYWADSDESCFNLEQLIKNDPNLKEEYHAKVNSLNALRDIPLWLKSGQHIIQRSMFDLYQDHILGMDPMPVSSRIDVSFLSYHGPFESMVLSHLFNPAMYQQFVMVLLLMGKLSRRSFRLRFKTRLLLEQNHSVHLVNLEQASSEGILLSSEKPLIEGCVNFFLDYQILKEAQGMSLEEMKEYISGKANNFLYSAHSSSRITLNTKGIKSQVKFDFMQRKVYYYFVSFERFGNKEAALALRDFTLHSKNLIGQTFKKAS